MKSRISRRKFLQSSAFAGTAAIVPGFATLSVKEQIGRALAEVGDYASNYGVEIRVCVHMHDLHDPAYPYRHFFKLLADSGYKGYCNAEIGRVSCEPVEFMKCYKGLFLALQNAL